MKVLVGLSGGVDSSVCAALLKKQGHEVAGATMRLFDGATPEDDARRVAEHLGIKHFVLDFFDTFKEKVTEDFRHAYQSGRTPNPCVLCNAYLKFGAMADTAREMGFDAVATGHYVKKVFDGTYKLCRSDSGKKDQSYFLYRLTQSQLAHAVFPLADMNKELVRMLAEELSLPVAQKKDSQEICFVPNDDYGAYLAASGVTASPGPVCLCDGTQIGQHNGLIHHTVGQRKGLGIAYEHPLYVLSLDTESNTLYVGKDSDLFASELTLCDVNWISGAPPISPIRVCAKIRYGDTAAPATVYPEENGLVRVVFDAHKRAICPGQSTVFYDGDTVLGGGIITKNKTV